MNDLFQDDWVTITRRGKKEHESCIRLVFSDGKEFFTWSCKCCLMTSESDHEWIMNHLGKISSMHDTKYGYLFDEMLTEVYIEDVLKDDEARNLIDDEDFWDRYETKKEQWQQEKSRKQISTNVYG